MSVNADDPTGKGPTGTVPDMTEIQKLIEDTVGKALSARLPRVKNTEETIAKMVAEAVAKLAPSAPAEPQEPSDKPNLKTLQEMIATERKARLDMEAKYKEEQQRGIQTRIRNEVRDRFAKVIGGDNPHLDPYVNNYLAQFSDRDGTTVRVTRDQFGNEEFLALDHAMEEMAKTELKHLIPARNGALPSNRTVGARGQEWQAPRPPQGMNPLDAEMLDQLGKTRPDLAAAIYANSNRK